MKNRRALSTLVGAVFFIIAASSTVAYVSYSMNVIDSFSQSVIIKESVDEARNSESFEITDAIISNNKFDLTVQNTGKLPVKLTKLWVENTTDTTWNATRFIIDQTIPPSGSVSGIGQSISLYAVDTQAYSISLISERGNSKTFSFNSVPDQSISINLHAAPENIANGFSTTLFMTVTNDLPTETTLLNIVPQLTMSGAASPVCDTSSSPSSKPTLKRGESVIFKWSCTITGSASQSSTFTASIVNGIPGNDASVTVTIQDVLLALESGTSLESLGFTIPSVNPDILIIHQETTNTPNGEYQLSSGSADSTGLTVDLDQNNMQFISNNKTSTISIPAGNWNASLTYLSSPLDSSINTSILTNGMIFHFEDSTDPHPNSSTGTSCDNEISADIPTGTNSPLWTSNSGAYSSGGYIFDGNDYISINVSTSCNDLDNGPNSSAGWFNVDSTGANGRQVILRAEESNPGTEFYEIVFDKSGTVGTLHFRFDSTEGKIIDCNITNVTTDEWHHFVAVREDSENCTLYLDGDGMIDTDQDTSNPNNTILTVNGNWLIGANPNTQGGQINEFFEGQIDSIMHWEEYALTSSEALALYDTKYGDGAHVVDYTIETVDMSGQKTTIYSQSNVAMEFIDPLQDLTDFYTSGNITAAMGAIDLVNERLLFTINFVEGLGIDVRIDDSDLTNPLTSFVQLPMPSTTFPGYFSYDTSSGNYQIKVANTGSVGAFFTISGIRGVFDATETEQAFASIPQYVNGTGTEFSLTDTNDSVYLPPGQNITIEFYPPTTHPSVDGQYGTSITPGDDYNFYIYLSGYDETGRTFFKTIDIGGATVY
ncbi:MAG: LamG domain-containing protein [Nitrosarchaeum sp.]|nr:LamG domain-containing protein [Nitrosarchaeum sp.]